MLPRKKQFAEHYAAHGNATQAAIVAGYSEKTAYSQGARLLKDVEIKAYVASLQESATSDAGVTIQRCVLELARIAFGDPRKLFTVDGYLKPIRDLGDEEAALLSQFEIEGDLFNAQMKRPDPNGEADEMPGIEFVPIKVGKLKRWDKVKSLELLMKYLGAFEKDNQQRALLDVSSLTPAELAILAGMYAKVNK